MTLTTEQAADAAGVKPAVIRKWVMRGWLEPMRRGAKPLRFDYDDVAKCQHEHRPKTWRKRHADAADRWSASAS